MQNASQPTSQSFSALPVRLLSCAIRHTTGNVHDVFSRPAERFALLHGTPNEAVVIFASVDGDVCKPLRAEGDHVSSSKNKKRKEIFLLQSASFDMNVTHDVLGRIKTLSKWQNAKGSKPTNSTENISVSCQAAAAKLHRRTNLRYT